MALRWTRKRLAMVGGAALVVIAALAVAAFALTGSADIVVYNGRSQYGDEQAFKAFEEQTGLKIELRGGTAPELFERLRREGAETPADLLVTTDLANLWRAKEAGLLEPVNTPALQRQVPEHLIAAGSVVTLEARRGTGILFHDLLFHASFPNRSGKDRWALISTYRDATKEDPHYAFATAAFRVIG